MIWALLLLACGTPQQGVSPAEQTDGLQDFSLVYTANVHGEIEPCG